ncbi:hypothetical protein MTR67_047614 [Solanum verrucosum]|uniref:Uncharacterized protein n=1 Tax=Solanum verrucosum TaxID=315347 RepID=A0AAF0ZZ72_SOLVR|nr:hypothetical protein MTR67_047614 [Solanum verrucosum]
MNRYSRINSKSKSKRKSVAIDFSDHLSLSISETPPIISQPHEEKSNKNDENIINGEEGDGEMFGVILERSRSVSSYKSMTEKERSSTPMKRSSSVSSSSAGGRGGGGYCKIHHRNDNLVYDEKTENFNVHKEKGNKILRACIKLLRFR